MQVLETAIFCSPRVASHPQVVHLWLVDLQHLDWEGYQHHFEYRQLHEGLARNGEHMQSVQAAKGYIEKLKHLSSELIFCVQNEVPIWWEH